MFNLSLSKQGVATLTFDMADEKVNKLTIAALDELARHVDELSKKPEVRALVIKSAKEGVFIAGADVKSFVEIFSRPSDAEALIKKGHSLFNRLSSLHFPTIAYIDGACLGGGLELALACSYRVVTDNPKCLLGLPEVNLGIMPGWGGTQRLPRLVGLEQGLNMILSGSSIDGRKAWKIKLADQLAAAEFGEEALRKFVERAIDFHGQMLLSRSREKRGLRSALLERNPLGRALLFTLSKRAVLKKTKGHYPAPLVALRLIKKSALLPLAEGLKMEIAAFSEALKKEFLLARNLIPLFLAQETVKKGPKLKAAPRRVDQAAIVGGGTMGGEIGWLFSYRAIPVRFKDVNWKAVGEAYGAVNRVYQTMKKLRKIKPDAANRSFHTVSGGLDYEGFAHADIVVEAVPEEFNLKVKVLAEIEAHTSPEAIIASNTSSLSITSMAATMKHPERFLGMHFFNPPSRMGLVELVPTEKSSEEALATVVELCKKMKKIPLVVKDCPGFLVNRVYAVSAIEAFWLLSEGIAIERIDRLMERFGMPMGPFTLADTVGNDIAGKVFPIFEKAYGERMRLPPGILKVAEAKLYGKKVGKGFYLYSGKKKRVNPEIASLLGSGKSCSVSDELIVERIIYAMINEAARALEEGVVATAEELDIGMIFGIGFPPFRGGVLRYADSLGLPAVVQKLETFAQLYGERFLPCKRLTCGSFYQSPNILHQTRPTESQTTR